MAAVRTGPRRRTLADPVRLQLVRELANHPDWTHSRSNFDVPVGRAAKSHHFSVLRDAGLVEQRDQGGPKRLNRLRREEFDAHFPALLDLALRAAMPAEGASAVGEFAGRPGPVDPVWARPDRAAVRRPVGARPAAS